MAVRDINMLPHDILGKSLQNRLFRFWGRWILLAVLVMAALNLACRHWVRGQEREGMAGTYANEQDVSRELEMINDANNQIRTLQEKGRTLARIVRKQVYYDSLAAFAGCFNDQTWIDSFSITRDEKTPDHSILNCRGFSVDHRTLGMFLDRISKVPRIKDLVLKDAGTRDDGTGGHPDFPDAVRFEISCTMTGGDR